MSRSKLAIGLLSTALGLAALAAPASAQDAANLPTIGVRFSDLDLGTAAGMATLNQRIEAAAYRLCAAHRVGPGYWGPLNFRRCVDTALAGARPQIQQAAARANGVRLARQATITVRGH